MSDQEQNQAEWAEINRAIARLRASVMATVFGLTAGTGLFVATLWLVVQGGQNGREIGPTLSLLNNYFPGYTVTYGGSIVGFFYAAFTGAALGWVVTMLYNLIAGKRHGPA